MIISTIVTTRLIGSVAVFHLEPKPGIRASNKCDSNADPCCIGKNFVILGYTQRTADVYAYDQSFKPIEGCTYRKRCNGLGYHVSNQTYILIVNEALYYGTKLDYSLLNQNQIRYYGLNF